jgi:protease-4
VSSRRGVVLVILLILAALAVSVVALVISAVFLPSAPPIPSNAALYVPINAPYPEIEPSDFFSQLSDGAPTLRATAHAIRRAKTDSRIKALVIVPKSAGVLWGQVQELRAAVEDFKTSGKGVTAFLESGGGMEYYLATAADRIIMLPAGQLDVVGVATYEVFLRGALDKLGVFPDLLHIGDYKTASNTFTEKGFTPAHREMSASMNRDWYDELVRAVAAGRKMPEAEAKKAIDGGPYLAGEALNARLVDALAYDDQIDDDGPVRGTRKLEAKAYVRSDDNYGPAGAARVALVYAVGTITSGESSSDAFGGLGVGSDSFIMWMRRARLDPNIRAVVVRVDSPGGSAVASEVMWREIKLTRDVKPVVVSMGDVAASGGYYIAAPAHAIVAQPGTLTGSIGVVTGKMVLKGSADKLGVGVDAVSDGPMSQIYSPFRPFSAEERTRVAAQMKATYDLFVARVAEGRNMTPEAVHAVAQGRVWTGAQAKARGLVDELGGLEVALRIAKDRAKLDPNREVSLVVYPPKRSFWEALTNPFGTGVRGAGVKELLPSPAAAVVDPLVRAAAMLTHFRRGEMLTLLPNVFVNGAAGLQTGR